MLLPEQVVPFLQHEDAMVREHALRYFRNCHHVGPLTADHYWAAIDMLGEEKQAVGFASALNDLPQTPASLRRLLAALASNPPELFDFHYQHAARDMDLNLLAENREELLSCPQLLSHVREHLELRLSLLGQSPAAAWDRLMEHGRELGDKYAFSFNYSLSDALIEAAARGGSAVCDLAMSTLADESAVTDWREIFTVRVLGVARYEPAIDVLVEKLNIDADILREEVNNALARIATPRVIERLVAFYPGKPWHVRLYAGSSPPRIKRPQSEEALLKLLGVELALEANPDPSDEGEPLIDSVLLSLTELCSLAALEESRSLIARFPEDPEALDLCESLIATAAMTGTRLPEEAAWRKLLSDQDVRLRAAGSIDSMFDGVRDQWRKTGIAFAPDSNTLQKPDSHTRVSLASAGDYPAARPEPFRHTAPKVGRNDPCPCGSGKKYKKCCGK